MVLGFLLNKAGFKQIIELCQKWDVCRNVCACVCDVMCKLNVEKINEASTSSVSITSCTKFWLPRVCHMS